MHVSYPIKLSRRDAVLFSILVFLTLVDGREKLKRMQAYPWEFEDIRFL